MSVASKVENLLVSESKLKGFVTPNYSGLGLANVAPTILSHFNINPKKHYKLSDSFLDYSIFKGVKKIVFMLFDGLGYDTLLNHVKTNKMGFSDLVKDGQLLPITSVLPSTTVSAMSSIHTGITPQEHGMLGYKMYLKEIKTIMNMIAFENVLGPAPHQITINLHNLLIFCQRKN